MEINKQELDELKEEYDDYDYQNECIDLSEYKDLDTMHLYMKQINQYPKLTPEDEKKLGKLILKGDEKAREQLVNSNLKLVVHIAKRYINASKLGLMDLIQEGNIGLIEASKKFDYRLGYKFSTYAAFWIKRLIIKALTDDSRTIRLPSNIVGDLMRITKARKEYELENDETPTNAQLSKILDLPEEEIERILEISKTPVSLDKTINDDEDLFMSDLISLPDTIGTDRLVKNDALRTILNSLSDRENQILTMRFGLDDGVNKTLEQVGEAVGLTRERVRQIEIKALRKLRDPQRIKLLKDLL